jgi:hypothetical protein
MLITFFGMKGTVTQDQTINEAYYVEVLKLVREIMRRKGASFWPTIDSPP